MTIQNNSQSSIDGWTLEWTFPGDQKISNLWNGSYHQSGAFVSVEGTGYNANIPANSTLSFGFNISYTGSNQKPTSFILNGITCIIQ